MHTLTSHLYYKFANNNMIKDVHAKLKLSSCHVTLVRNLVCAHSDGYDTHANSEKNGEGRGKTVDTQQSQGDKGHYYL